VLFSLVLSAMQVGIGVDRLKNSVPFNQASYGFVVFISVLVVAVLVFVLSVFSFIFFYNMVAAIRHSSNEQKRRASVARKRKERTA